MICLNCESEFFSVIYAEVYPCAHCGEDLIIEFCSCTKCGTLWRAVNGEIIKESVVTTDDLINALTPLNDFVSRTESEMTSEEKEFLKRIEEELIKHDKIETDQASMGDMIHRCMKCETIVDEVRPGVFECPACEFSWEVFKFE